MANVATKAVEDNIHEPRPRLRSGEQPIADSTRAIPLRDKNFAWSEEYAALTDQLAIHALTDSAGQSVGHMAQNMLRIFACELSMLEDGLARGSEGCTEEVRETVFCALKTRMRVAGQVLERLDDGKDAKIAEVEAKLAGCDGQRSAANDSQSVVSNLEQLRAMLIAAEMSEGLEEDDAHIARHQLSMALDLVKSMLEPSKPRGNVSPAARADASPPPPKRDIEDFDLHNMVIDLSRAVGFILNDRPEEATQAINTVLGNLSITMACRAKDGAR